MKDVNFIFLTYESNTLVTADKCNAIDFINKGAANVNINDITLTTNQSLSLSCHRDEVDTSKYTIQFAAVGVRQLHVLKKFIN